MWILLTLIWIIILLILPIEIYDHSTVLILIAGVFLTGFLVYKLFKQILPNFKSPVLIFLFIVGFGYLNLESYKYRRNRLFDTKGKTTTAEVVDKKVKQAKSTSIYYIYYSYIVNGESYTEKDNVDFNVYFNFDLGPTINIDYVDGRPSISRINQSSLIPDPEAHDKFMKWQKKEYVKNKNKN
jgi:energy-coupling factor transporter transmembrane protein EcfT